MQSNITSVDVQLIDFTDDYCCVQIMNQFLFKKYLKVVALNQSIIIQNYNDEMKDKISGFEFSCAIINLMFVFGVPANLPDHMSPQNK